MSETPSAAFNQGPSPDAPFACLDGEGGVCGECEDCNPSAAYLRSCACVKTCGDVAATDDHPQAVCKGLAVKKERRSKDELTKLATGDYDAIPWLDLHYDDWLWLQHFWQRQKLGLEEGEPLAVALEALDRITRLALNGSGSDPYWIARMALDKLGLWPKDESDA